MKIKVETQCKPGSRRTGKNSHEWLVDHRRSEVCQIDEVISHLERG